MYNKPFSLFLLFLSGGNEQSSYWWSKPESQQAHQINKKPCFCQSYPSTLSLCRHTHIHTAYLHTCTNTLFDINKKTKEILSENIFCQQCACLYCTKVVSSKVECTNIYMFLEIDCHQYTLWHMYSYWTRMYSCWTLRYSMGIRSCTWLTAYRCCLIPNVQQTCCTISQHWQ